MERSGLRMAPREIGPDYCPACGSEKIVPGALGPVFVPYHCAPETQARVRLPATGRACVRCGLIWTVARPEVVLDRLRQTGDALVAQQVEGFERGPLHGLPSGSFEAKVAAQCVGEIDRLVWSGAIGEASRRYRSYTGRRREEVAATIRAWATLSRAEKLRRLGWEGSDPAGEAPSASPGAG